jgi:urease accessory protein
MLRASEIIRAGLWDGVGTDVVRLDFDLRTRRRITLKGVNGLVFLLDLPKAPVLRTGDGLRLSDGRMIAVEAAAERLLAITCGDEQALARIAWHLGNRHLAAEIGVRTIHIRDDHVIADMARGLGAQAHVVERPFNPEGGAYAAGGRHGHHHNQRGDHDHGDHPHHNDGEHEP